MRPRGSPGADMFVDINLADCTTPKRFGHIFFRARAEYNPKLITTRRSKCSYSSPLRQVWTIILGQISREKIYSLITINTNINKTFGDGEGRLSHYRQPFCHISQCVKSMGLVARTMTLDIGFNDSCATLTRSKVDSLRIQMRDLFFRGNFLLLFVFDFD